MPPSAVQVAEGKAQHKYVVQHTLAKTYRDLARRRLRRVLAALGVLAVVGALAVPALYFWQFHGALSTNTEDWNRFGGFVGGTLGPFFGALTIAAVLAGVLLQREQVDLAAEQAEGALIHEAVIVTLQEETARAMAEQARHAAIGAKATTLASVRELMELDIESLRATAGVMGNLPADEHGNNLLAQAVRRRDRVAAELQHLVDQLIGVQADGTPLGMQQPPAAAEPATPAG